jgi:TRAP-type uncharacterized transport system fused permease subunit
MFTLSREGAGVLLIGTPRDILQAGVTALAGVAALAAGFGGWIVRRASPAERAIAVAGGLLLCYGNPWSDLLGAALTAVVLFLHFGRHPGSTSSRSGAVSD